MPEDIRRERHTVAGEKLLQKVKELVHEGNVRRIIIKDQDKTIVEIPLTVGVVGALLAPHLAALGAIAAMIAHTTIEVEKVADVKTAPPPPVMAGTGAK
jgi:hypothetical protein